MELTRTESTGKSKKDLSQEAISLALKGEWEQAVGVNQSILELFPSEVEAMNRLGKALMEVGEYSEAKCVLDQVVSVAPYNNIAKKNLARLSQLETVPSTAGRKVRKVSPLAQGFIADSGKSGTSVLQSPATGALVGSIAPSEPAQLVLANNLLNVYVRNNEYLGRVEPKLALRLGRLIEGGNEYEAAVIGVNDRGISIMIRETYRHPSQQNACPFPSRGKEEQRVYVGDEILRSIEESSLDDFEEREVLVDTSSEESEWDE